ncbi:MAG: hypothetical protein RR547_00355, partial [Raoultibacter sp.]
DYECNKEYSQVVQQVTVGSFGRSARWGNARHAPATSAMCRRRECLGGLVVVLLTAHDSTSLVNCFLR